MMARRKKEGLGERKKKILVVLEKFGEMNGYPPSIREICEETSISSTSVVNYYLNQLEDDGYIERDRHVSRGIRLIIPLSQVVNPLVGVASKTASSVKAAAASVKQGTQTLGQALDELLRVPVVGRITAGSPVPVPASDFAYYDADSTVDIAISSLPAREHGEDLFALEVQGNSMIDAMVYDGDIVIMKLVQEARNGEMVAVWLNDRDETTLKYFYQENDRVRLQPANPTMAPIIIDDPSTVDIQGKVVMVIRKVKGQVS